MLNIDQRLENAYRLLSQENRNGSLNSHEMDMVKETIFYLRDFAKLQEETRLVGSRKGIHMEIEEQIQKLQKKLEEKKAEFSSIPRYRISGENTSGYVGRFQEIREEQRKKEIEERASQIREKKAHLKYEIKELIGKIKVLEKTKESTLTNPKKLGKLIFTEETEKQEKEYKKLLTYCEKIMFDGRENDIFVKDEMGNIQKVNLLKAKRFLKKIKDQESIMQIADCAVLSNEIQELSQSMNTIKNDKRRLDEIKHVSDSVEMRFVLYGMNSLIEEFNQLRDAEEIAMRGGPLNRIHNKIRRAFGFLERTRVPKKILAKREKFANNVNDFILEMGKNEESMKALNAYCHVRSKEAIEGVFTINDFKNMVSQLHYGAHRVTSFPRTIMDMQKWEETLEHQEGILHTQEESLNQRKEELEKKQNMMIQNLSPKAQKMLETDTQENILSYAQKYYGFKKVGTYAPGKYAGINEFSASTAAVILESIIGRSAKNLSWDKFVGTYGELYGEERIAEETANLHNFVKAKVKMFKEKVSEFTGLSRSPEMRDEVER